MGALSLYDVLLFLSREAISYAGASKPDHTD